MTKKWLAYAVAALGLVSPALAQSTISFGYWGDPPELPPFEEIVSKYQAAHPDVKIEIQHAPWSGYFTRLDSQLAAGAGPDVFFITNVPSYASRGALAPLDDLIKASNFPIDQYVPSSLLTHSFEGKLYSIPRDSAPSALYYNSDAFDAVGVAYPNADWKWADLRDAAIKLTTTEGGRITRYGLALESNDWATWVQQNGGKVFDDPLKPTTFLLAEPAAVEAIQYIGDLINKDKVTPNFLEAEQAGGTAQLFSSGQAAMVITNPSRLGTFADVPFKWAVANLPGGPTGIHSNRTGGAGFAINANSKNPEAAWAFLQYLAGPEGQSIFAGAKAAAVPAMTGNETVRAAFKAPFGDVFLKEADVGEQFPQFPRFVDLSNLYIQPALDLVWNGESTAADAIGGIKDKVNAELAK
ncbi:sugar ABC transporter substrate-binding protein [Devosia sp. Root413D1]|uniref:ABC transporter substrate-binding protein n=1 Tax=Devosia sp. Root413D1 TaxID=1736531 RepID=UPI0009EC058B|nr:sugar ABC transporter substrate-binding protein [Devosia sp. Root413D1]